MRDAVAARKRAQEYRRRNAEQLLESSGNGTANGSPNGSLLRTNERTNLTTGGRKRGFQQPEPYAPRPFCESCGGGMGKVNPDDLKLVIIHAEGCREA